MPGTKWPTPPRTPLEQRRVDLELELMEMLHASPYIRIGMSLEEYVRLLEKSKRDGKMVPYINRGDDPRVLVD